MYAVDSSNNTALHHAAENHNHLAVKHLVEVGAPLEIKNKDVSLPHDQSSSKGCTCEQLHVHVHVHTALWVNVHCT